MRIFRRVHSDILSDYEVGMRRGYAGSFGPAQIAVVESLRKLSASSPCGCGAGKLTEDEIQLVRKEVAERLFEGLNRGT